MCISSNQWLTLTRAMSIAKVFLDSPDLFLWQDLELTSKIGFHLQPLMI